MGRESGGVLPSTKPPAVLSEQKLVDIQAFIASLPAPRAVQDIPLLNP